MKRENWIRGGAFIFLVAVLFIRFFIGIKPSKAEVVEEPVEIKTTENKTAIFFGDSIMSGWLTHGYGVPNYIGDKYDLRSVTNASQPDYRVASYDDGINWLLDEVEPYKDNTYDYVILQGGINDMLLDTPLGNISNTKSIEDLNPKIYSEALELYILTCKEYFPTAKMGYIVSYYIPKYKEGPYYWTLKEQQSYNEMTIAILEKYNIPYINLFEDKYSELLKVDTKEYLPDYLHPNKEGNEILYPIIYEWMKEL